MIQDGLKVTGAVSIRVFDKNGVVKDSREIKNLVVTSGRNFIASRMTGSTTAMSHMAIGSGTTAADVANTTLQTELGRVALTSATTTGAVTTYVATFGAGTGTGAVTEAGVLNAGSGGTMLCRSVFPVVNKGADDGMSITWQITVS